MSLRIRTILLVIAFVSAWTGGSLAAPEDAEVEASLERGLSLYSAALEETDRDARLARFAQAEAAFASVVRAGHGNVALLTNLGNAALQSEQTGQAVLAYRRALALDPNAAAARQNLDHIRSLLPAWVPRPSPSEGLEALYFYRRIPVDQRSTLAGASFLVAAMSLAIAGRRRDGAWRGLAVVAALAWLLLLGSVVLDRDAGEAKAAVVTTDEVLARSADSRLAALALPDPLPAGTEVELLEARAEWARVRLHNGRDVWLHRSDVTLVDR